jgi:hypothetical protein
MFLNLDNWLNFIMHSLRLFSFRAIIRTPGLTISGQVEGKGGLGVLGYGFLLVINIVTITIDLAPFDRTTKCERQKTDRPVIITHALQ